MTQAPIFV